MLFNSLNFLIFFLVVYSLYLLLPHRGQNILLLIASYFFYGCWDYRFLSLLLLSTLVDFFLAKAIDDSDSPRKRRTLLIISMCVSLSVLGFFKYCNFFIDNMTELLGALGFEAETWHLNIILPWGISFYTFQTMNYTIDVYRRHLKANRNFLDFAVFVSFFPHLVAGPIMRAASLLVQVTQPRSITRAGIEEGCWLIFWGLFKKVVIADNLAGMVDEIFGGQVPLTAGVVLVGVYAFAYQIYCDFSGYSDMARGLGKLMGFDIVINFNRPYFAIDPSDFWRRWHISLSTWLRDYLYIPLGGNRKGPRRTYINLALTMLLGGLWHGAAWTFVIWGAFHGILLAIHRLINPERSAQPILGFTSRLWRCVVMFHLVCLGWLLFRAQSMSQVVEMLRALFLYPSMGPDALNSLLALLVLCTPLWCVELLQEKTGRMLAHTELSVVCRTTLYAVMLLALVALGNTGGHAFIYFQF